MQALVYTRYGSPDVLHLTELPKPTPKDDEVLIKVHAASLNSFDLHLLRADPFLVRLMAGGLLKPKYPVLGADVAGRVEAVGKNAHQFQIGAEVFGDLAACNCGALGEYVCAKETAVALKPANLSFEEAAAVPMAAVTALQGLRDMGRLQAGQSVLINGASGGVGPYAVQIAKALGADVTAVCSPRNMDLAYSLRADHLIDYTQEDFTRSGRRYDLILAANGYQSGPAYQRALAPQGRCVVTGGTMPQIFQTMLLGPWLSRGGRPPVLLLSAAPKQSDLLAMKALIETGQVRPVIDRRYPLRDAVDAFRYVDTGHARGKVVITVAEPEATQRRAAPAAAQPDNRVPVGA